MKRLMLQIRGVRYRILLSGSENGFPVLLLHGFTGSAESWHKAMTSDEEFQWIAPDLLGHGETASPWDWTRYTMHQQVDDLFEIMKVLGFHQFACLGYSMGGRVAVALSVTYSEQVKALVLESTSPGLASEEERIARADRDNSLAHRIETVGVEQFVSEWEKIPLFATQTKLREDTLRKQRDIRLHQVRHGLSNSLRGMGTGVQPSYWNQLEVLQFPVLLVTGGQDGKFSDIAEQMSNVSEDVQHVSVAQAGHTVHLEQPVEFWNLVSTFLQSQLN